MENVSQHTQHGFATIHDRTASRSTVVFVFLAQLGAIAATVVAACVPCLLLNEAWTNRQVGPDWLGQGRGCRGLGACGAGGHTCEGRGGRADGSSRPPP